MENFTNLEKDPCVDLSKRYFGNTKISLNRGFSHKDKLEVGEGAFNEQKKLKKKKYLSNEGIANGKNQTPMHNKTQRHPKKLTLNTLSICSDSKSPNK